MKRKISLILLLLVSLLILSSCTKKSNIELFEEKLNKNPDPSWYSVTSERRYYSDKEKQERCIEATMYADLNGPELYGVFEEIKLVETAKLVKYDDNKVIVNTIEENELICKENRLFIKKSTTNLLTNEKTIITFGSSNIGKKYISEITESPLLYSFYVFDKEENYDDVNTYYVSDDLKTLNVYQPQAYFKSPIGSEPMFDATGYFKLTYDEKYNPILIDVKQTKNYDLDKNPTSNGFEIRRVIAKALNEGISIDVPLEYEKEYETKENRISIKF